MLSFISINAFGIYVHYDDEYFYYFYPLPFAIDSALGPSMLPTMGGGVSSSSSTPIDKNGGTNEEENQQGGEITSNNYFYLRDCFSNRILKRPWQKGDVVTLYNPHTKYFVTKRIIGVGGDTVCVFGEYAEEFYQQRGSNTNESDTEYTDTDIDGNGGGNNNQYEDCKDTTLFGMTYDARFHVPFCFKQQSNTIIVPQNHVWLEGDNPLHSTDSRHYGPIPESSVRGRVVLRIWPIIVGSNSNATIDGTRPAPSFKEQWIDF